MKENKFLVFTMLVFLALAGIVCKRNVTDDVRVNVNTDLYQAPMLVRFLNANQNATTQPDGFTVTITGKDAALIVTPDGGKVFKVLNGSLVLAINSVNTPSTSNPLEFTIYAKIDGFAPVSQAFRITGSDPSEHTIMMIQYIAPAEGTAAVSQSIDMDSTGTTGNKTISTPTRSDMPLSAGLQIEKGTKVYDKDGNEITASSIETNVVMYGADNNASLNAFPGGFSPASITGKDGSQMGGDGSFITAGFLSINMDAGGKQVKSFSKPVAVHAEVPASLTNPVSGNTIAEGDSVPVWSLNEETGAWKYESNCVIAKNSNGKLEAQFSISHLSAWNVDWFAATCNTPLTVTIAGMPASANGRYWLRLVTPNNQYLSGLYTNTSWSQGELLFNGFTATMPKVPSTTAKFIVLSDRYTINSTTIVAESETFNPCTKNSVTLNWKSSAPAVPELVNVIANVQGRCKSKNVNINMGNWFTILPQNNVYNSTNFYAATNNTKTFVLENNKTYTLQTTYNNKVYSTTITVQKTGFTIPNVEGLSGTATYNAVTNTITINATLTIPDC